MEQMPHTNGKTQIPTLVWIRSQAIELGATWAMKTLIHFKKDWTTAEEMRSNMGDGLMGL